MSTLTYTVQIGNSDDKLPQKRWVDFLAKTSLAINRHAAQIHFRGNSLPIDPHQNACWVFEMDERRFQYLDADLSDLCSEFDQDSIALTEGKTYFVRSRKPCKHIRDFRKYICGLCGEVVEPK